MRKKKKSKIVEGDLTPMIDMTFQLIAFFMVLINFTQTEYNQEVQLPQSELAKPPDRPFEYPIMLHLTRTGEVVYAGDRISHVAGLQPYLERERAVLRLKDMPVSEATVIVRADKDTPHGMVQELIQLCQHHRFENFALRAEEDVGNY